MKTETAVALLESAGRLIETAQEIMEGGRPDYYTVYALTRQARLAVEKVEKAARDATRRIHAAPSEIRPGALVASGRRCFSRPG
ncbi:MAG: hypothetical protein F4107_08565 [Gemmatimonadetes bacterium]|nr:hypothetical protein [Gemmatimonadota bacterium]MYD13972.1 hypothetical protein [Gemmatimonadota bacterium]MYI65969.1 hypothetical protein [Gemmatimonadota bacterium]